VPELTALARFQPRPAALFVAESDPMDHLRTLISACALCVIVAPSTPLHAAGAGGKQSIPDFTQGEKTDGSHDWTLGPTGARGWIYTWKNTADARQILVTPVAKD